MVKEYNVILISNVKSLDSNTIASFTTFLNKKIELKGEWLVGISSIEYNKSWYNITNNQSINVYDESGKVESSNTLDETKMFISSGYYKDEETLINEINNQLDLVKNVVPPRLFFNKFNKICKIKLGETNSGGQVYPKFSDELENMLGFKNRNIQNNIYNKTERFDKSNKPEIFVNKNSKKSSYIDGYHPIEINAGLYSIYVYSNIVYPSLVGDSFSQILKVVEVPNETEFGNTSTVHYQNIQYFPVLFNEISSIEIDIRDDSGNLIPFKFGRVRIDLHFKKAEY